MPAILALLASLVIIVIAFEAMGDGWSRWVQLFNQRLFELFSRTLSLMALSTVIATFWGISLAWAVEKTTLWGNRFWRWGLALPLVIPPYIGALAFLILFRETNLPIYNLPVTALIMAAFTFPYVFLIVSAALRRMNTNLEEAAQACGKSPSGVFFQVTIPALRPAIIAGATLVALYILGDFGAVSILRYDTFASAIFFRIRGSLDFSGATIISTVLLLTTFGLLGIQRFALGKCHRYQQKTEDLKEPKKIPLGKWHFPILFYVVLVFIFSTLLPAGVLIYWSWLGISAGTIDTSFFQYLFNSLTLAGGAAFISLIFSLPFSYLQVRHPGLLTSVLSGAVFANYSLPGVIVGLALILIGLNFFPFLYNTPLMVIIAYLLRFFPQNLQAARSSFLQLSPNLEEASQSMGFGPLKTLFSVILPNIGPGLLAGASLVFVSSLKELPASLLLRPAGMDTLAIRIWMEASEGFYSTAAPFALLLILISIFPLRYLLNRF